MRFPDGQAIQVIQQDIHFGEPHIPRELKSIEQLFRLARVEASAGQGGNDIPLPCNGVIAAVNQVSGFVELPEQLQFTLHSRILGPAGRLTFT